ncbi:hypothetical protein [Enterobacter ludwigii]|uniref:hypothetical protein n=1 Tax=Enterobacter ludwigii TaxID=299767 RepID=UPI003F710731
MSKIVVTDGDTLAFDTNFDANIVTPVAPCLIRGSGEASITNKKICVLGDERNVSIAATYIKSTHPTPGAGTITLYQLNDDQQAQFATAQQAVIVVGSQFTARFTPTSPAMDPQGKPDPNMSPTAGTGKFINSQSFVTAG